MSMGSDAVRAFVTLAQAEGEVTSSSQAMVRERCWIGTFFGPARCFGDFRCHADRSTCPFGGGATFRVTADEFAKGIVQNQK